MKFNIIKLRSSGKPLGRAKHFDNVDVSLKNGDVHIRYSDTLSETLHRAQLVAIDAQGITLGGFESKNGRDTYFYQEIILWRR